jgi:stage V sporulation protein G
MEITNIEIRPLINPKESFGRKGYYIKAYASVTFDDSLVVHSIKLIETPTGNYIIEMHKNKMGNGRTKDMYHPINKQFRQTLKYAIIDAYLESN